MGDDAIGGGWADVGVSGHGWRVDGWWDGAEGRDQREGRGTRANACNLVVVRSHFADQVTTLLKPQQQPDKYNLYHRITHPSTHPSSW